jgi:hypothetical protein
MTTPTTASTMAIVVKSGRFQWPVRMSIGGTVAVMNPSAVVTAPT